MSLTRHNQTSPTPTMSSIYTQKIPLVRSHFLSRISTSLSIPGESTRRSLRARDINQHPNATKSHHEPNNQLQTVPYTIATMCETSFTNYTASTTLASSNVCRTCYNPYSRCCCGTNPNPRNYSSSGSANCCKTCNEPYSQCCCNVKDSGSVHAEQA